MPHISYTIEQLHRLKESPLCIKPPHLPAIEQWMEVSTEPNGNRTRKPNPRAEEQNGHEGGLAARPLFQTRQSARNNAEDVFLGPPTMKFNSNRNRTADQDKDRQTFGDDTEKPLGSRNRGLRDHEEGLKDRNNVLGRRNNREDNAEADEPGWSKVNRRRGSQNEEGADRWQLGNPRHRKEAGEGDEQPRRNGAGRGARMGAWRGDDQGDHETPRANTRWRERTEREDRPNHRGHEREERPSNRFADRDWTRGSKVQDRVEEEPEWFDESAEASTQRTAADFEKFRATQRAKNNTAAAKEEPQSVQQAPKEEKPVAAKPVLDFRTLGTFGSKKEPKQEDSTTTGEKPAPALLSGLGTAAANTSTRASKFGAFFKKDNTPPRDLPRDPEEGYNPLTLAQRIDFGPAQPSNPSGMNGAASTTLEDKEGFNRILQMLDKTKISSPAPQPTNEPNPLSQLLSAAQQEQNQRAAAGTSRPDSASIVNELLARTANRSRGPQTAPANDQEASQYLAGHAMTNGRDENVLPRGGHPPFSPGPQMNGQVNRPDEEKRDYLMKLIENSRAKQAHQQQTTLDFLRQQNLQHPNGINMPPGLMQQPQREPLQRVTPSAPPGLPALDNQLGGGLRKTSSRPQGLSPMFDESHHDPAILGMPGLARRNTSEMPQPLHLTARPPVSNMGIPSQNAPINEQYRLNGMLPPVNQDPRPPPGFPMRQGYQQPQMRGMPPPPPGMYQNGQGQGPMPPSQQQNHGHFPPPPGFGAPGAPPPPEFFMQQMMGRGGMPGRGGPPGYQ